MVVQVMDDKRSVARHFMVEKIWNSSGSKFEAYEDIRIILYKNDLPFLRTGKVDIYYGQLYQADEFAQNWWTTKNNKNFYTGYCYPGTCKEAFKTQRMKT
jgi:hypothetical protein